MLKSTLLISLSIFTIPVAFAANVHGVVRAVDQAVISTELNARVLSVAKKEGEHFVKDDLLIAFDCDKYTADLRAAEAEQKLNAAVYQNSIELERRRAVGALEVVQNKARLEKATALRDGLGVRVAGCQIKAPFSGTMGEVHIHPSETSVPNQPLFQIFNSTDLEVELIVPSAYLAWLKPGAPFTAHVTETGESVPANVTRISAAVDPVSQTVKIMGKFANDQGKLAPADVRPGMSLDAEFAKAGN